MRWFAVVNESLRSAYQTVTLNKMRTFLSLLGVTIGIFCIVSVFTVLDSLESNIRASLDTFGSDIVIIDKWPWSPEEGTEYAWWEYMNRPVVTMDEYRQIRERLPEIRSICFISAIMSTIQFMNNSADNIQVWGTSEEFSDIRSFTLQSGRFFTPLEIGLGKSLCLIGYSIADELFNGLNPIGRTIRVNGRKAEVIGVFGKEGSSSIGGGSLDEVVLLPVRFLGTMTDLKDESSNPQIWIKAGTVMTVSDLKINLRRVMRSLRRLGPSDKDNFALNQTSLISAGLDQIFRMVGLAGWVIGIFAVLVGGFGIANIMFVSVKERTNIIGIQKALGAKNQYIVLEVLYESVLLSIIGGIAGLLFIYLGTFIAKAKDFEVFLSIDNIVFGLFISTVIGLIAGLLPATMAARLDPVKAINSTF